MKFIGLVLKSAKRTLHLEKGQLMEEVVHA